MKRAVIVLPVASRWIHWLAVAMILLPASAWATGFSSQTIDDPGTDVGRHNSLILDSAGQPHVAYWDFFFQDLEYAVRVGGIWSKQTVDAAGEAGQSPSIALDLLERPHIAYLETGEFDLRYAWFNGAVWTVEKADTTGMTGAWPSLEMTSSGQPCISYYDFSNQDLLYIQKVAGNWNRERVDSIGTVGANTSLALDLADRPHISYHDVTNRDLKYATKVGGNWVVETVDGPDEVGASTSIQLDSSGNPCIAYYDLTNDRLKYAVKTGGNWNIEFVTPAGPNQGANLSHTLDANDSPHISHWDVDFSDLLYSWKRDGIGWFTEQVATVGEVGQFSSIAMDAQNKPKISFYDFTNKSLRFAEGVRTILVPTHYPTISQGIFRSNPGDTVEVEPGTYSGGFNTDIFLPDWQFTLRTNGAPLSVQIDCANLTRGFSVTNGNGPETVIEGFRIQNADFAAIDILNGSPTIRNCIFENAANGMGVYVYGADSNPLIEDCDFLNNDVGFSPGGGGMLIEGSQGTVVRRCDFSGNVVSSGSASILRGGGILCVGASPLIWESNFRGNLAEEGGAIAYYESSPWPSAPGPKIEGTLIAGNLATNEGGAVWFEKANTWISGTTISGNEASNYGGGVHFGTEDTIKVKRTIIWDNCAGIDGDEMMLDLGTPAPGEIEISFECSDVDATGFSGSGDILYFFDTIFVNPQFENPEICNNAPTTLGDYGLECFSPCLPGNSPCGQLIGAPEEFCPLVAVDDPFAAPEALHLHAAFPNPFSGRAVIQYEIPQAARVMLSVYDLRGRQVRVLESSAKEPGRYSARWDGRDGGGNRVSSGMYFYRLQAGGITETRRVMFLAGADD